MNEEEDLIEKHKQHVNEIINVEKQEMQLIAEVEPVVVEGHMSHLGHERVLVEEVEGLVLPSVCDRNVREVQRLYQVSR